MDEQVLTIKLRLRDKHASLLNRKASLVNFVWNYCNETQQKAARSFRPWLSKFDLMKLTAGSSKILDLSGHTIQQICSKYADSRQAQRKPWLKWRSHKSLGWVPFNTGTIRFDGIAFIFNKHRFEVMHLRDILKPGMKIGAGSFNADSKGCWYINLPITVEQGDNQADARVGIDLGLKSLATMSDGGKIEMPRFYRQAEAALASSQRLRKSKRVRTIHAKIANRRKDFLHKASASLCKKYGFIVVGDVSPSKLAKTRMAKSVHDAGWADFKHMLSYKAIRHGGRMIEVSEAYSSQTCSMCGSLPASRPRGIAGLAIREWECSDCGMVHDRDVNAARNILRTGLGTLAEGAALSGAAKHRSRP